MHRLLHLGVLAAGIGAAAAAAPDPAMVTVLAHAVDRGDVITAGDLADAAVPAGGARDALRPAAIAGMAAARRLPTGSIVRAADIARPQLVRRGEPVTIRWRQGALTITAQGRALAGGAAGDAVRVVTGAGSRTLDAIVEGSGDVRLVN